KPLLHSRYRLRIGKADASVAYIKKYPAFPGFVNKGFYLVGLYVYNILTTAQLPKAMCKYITRAQMFHKQFLYRQRRITSTKIYHSRYATRQGTGFNSTVSRSPVMAFVMGQLNAYYNVPVFPGNH